jgi:hypothetical protein
MVGPAGLTRPKKSKHLTKSETSGNPDISRYLSQCAVSAEVPHARTSYDPESEKGRLGKGSPEFAKSSHPRHYHIPTDVQAFLIGLSPLWFAIVLALCVRAS